MTDFNPQRLSVARRRRGRTKTALAEALDISVRMVTAYERGEKTPSHQTLERLSQALDFPEEFFQGDDLSEPSLAGTSFRALSNLTARQRDQARGAATLALALANWLDDRLDLPLPSVPQYPGVDPDVAAMSVRAEWGAGERPVGNMIHLLEAHGVRFFSLVEECAAVDAFSFWSGEEPYVVLNTGKSGERRRMDAAHELGHLVLHPSGTAHGRKQEQEAVQFASSFLMPEGSVRGYAPYGGTLQRIVAAKGRWGVSVAALTYRMRYLKMLTDWQYRSLFVEMGKRSYRTKEPNSIQPETSTLLDKAFRILRSQGITREQIAEDLRITVPELNKLVFGLVLTLIGGRDRGARRALETPANRPDLTIVGADRGPPAPVAPVVDRDA